MNTYSELARRAPSMWDSRRRSRVAAGDLSVRHRRTNAVHTRVTRPMIARGTSARKETRGCAPSGCN